jgi:predicted small lipoprotein YifL
MPADPPSSPALRASDADRDRVIEVLRAAVADGRLNQAEFDERLDAALAARTIDALALLTADLIAAPGRDGALTLPPAETPAGPAAELITISEKHGSVRRDGRWTLPRRLALHTAWCDVMLDLTSAVRSGPELVIELRVRGGDVELVLAPGMVVDANELSVRHTTLAISRDAGDNTPETLCVRLAGRMRHGRISTRWLAPRQ